MVRRCGLFITAGFNMKSVVSVTFVTTLCPTIVQVTLHHIKLKGDTLMNFEITLPRDNKPNLKFKGSWMGEYYDDLDGCKYTIYQTDDSVKSCDYVLHIDNSTTRFIVATMYEVHTFDSINSIKSYILSETSGDLSSELLEILGVETAEYLE